MQLMMSGFLWLVCEFGQVLGELLIVFSEVGELDDVCVCLDYVVVMIEQVMYCILDLVEECCSLIEQLCVEGLQLGQDVQFECICYNFIEIVLIQSYQDLIGQIICCVVGIVCCVYEGFGVFGLLLEQYCIDLDLVGLVLKGLDCYVVLQNDVDDLLLDLGL